MIGLLIACGEKKVFFAPGLPGKSSAWKAKAAESDLVLLDSTFWSDDELVAIRGGGKGAREMGHPPLSGSGGLLEELRHETRPRKVAIHINNTNPILDETARNTARCGMQVGKSRAMEWSLCCEHERIPGALISGPEFVARFQAIGEERYHHKHPFHLLMHEGKLTRGQLQAWALNRYYYQSRIPIKDAAILARSEDADFRRAWRKRIIDHDGDGTRPGGIEKWLKLVEATGLSREQAIDGGGILPATRYAVEAYVNLVRSRIAS